MSSVAEGPPAIDEPLPGLEEVEMQEQPMEGPTGNLAPTDGLIPPTVGDGLLICGPLPCLEKDVKLQEQSVVNESTHSKSVLSAFPSQARNNLISVLQRSRNSNNSAQP